MSETTTKRLVMERKKRESREMFACELKLRPKNVKNVGTLETVPYPESVRLPNLELNFPVEPGRFRYDRGFLLQFMSVCKQRPASLAPLGALGLEPYNTSREGANSTHRQESPSASQARHTSSNAIVSSAPFRSTTGRPMFTPRGAIQGGARGGYPGQNGRARNQRGNTRGNGPRSSELHTPGSQAAIIQLVSRPEATEGPSIGTDTLDSHQRQHLRARWLIIIKYRVKALLNRLAVDNFESISKKIIGWANRSEGEKDEIFLKRIVSLVVEHAKSGAAFSELYARLCRKMVEQISSNVQDETIHDSQGQPIAGGALFRKYLLSYCHYEFECRWCPEETPISVEPEDNVAEATSQASRRHAADLNPYKATKAKRQDLGLVRFICELFRLQMLNERAVHDCVKVLLSNIINPGEEEIVALNVIFTTIGPSLDNFKGKDHIDIYFERMQEMVKGNISWRLRFLLMASLK
ncbi:Eukaryotic translation initiation factor 4 gamma [Rhizoctonia solani]|uniref:Eukaryotic translation initiation factor 4 gamma n=1 Tax=Rhizoctonia solani TaxID=456999 RepID=A0A0K6G7T5_9AGAM|nr:Eukaryotic translation initiation factor 4 gamma [Rhizoctonia solani]